MLFRRIIANFAMAFLLFFSSYFAFAQTTSQPTIEDLQKQIQKLQQQLQSLQQQLAASTPPALTRSLARGSSGEDVRKLQKFLAGDKEIYPEGLVTGYFGPLTEAAVKKWQEKHAIESVGIIGPKTKAKFGEIIEQRSATTTAGQIATLAVPATPAVPSELSSTTPATTTPLSVVPLCTTDASACAAQKECLASGFFWYTVSCHRNPPIINSCAASYNYCVGKTECSANGYYWCKNSCYGSVDACVGTTYVSPVSPPPPMPAPVPMPTTNTASTTTSTATTTTTATTTSTAGTAPPAPVNSGPAPAIQTGTGSVADSDNFNLGSGMMFYSVSGYGASGYIYTSQFGTSPTVSFANATPSGTTDCDPIGPYAAGYRGINNICQFTSASNYTFSTPSEVRIYDKASSCYQGILLFKQGNIYGAIDPEDVASDFPYNLNYRYWYDANGGSNFSSLCSASAANQTTNF